MCRFIVNWKITVLQLTVKLFHEISDLNIQRMYTILFSSSFKLLGCQLNPNSSFRCRYFIWGWQYLVTCGTYHIFCWVLRLELCAPRRVWCPPSCRWYHLIPSVLTVSPWWPVLHSPELRPDCPLSAHVPPPPRRVPPPAPRASAAGRRNVAKLARSLAAEHMPSEARGYLVRTVRTRWTKICNLTCQRVCYVEICECIQLFCTTNSKRFSSFQSLSLILDIQCIIFSNL